MALTKEFLLQKLWESCTFDEIINAGLEKNKCTSTDIIEAASEYGKPANEYSDDEIKDIVQNADIDVVMDALKDKYKVREIIKTISEDDILNCFDFSDIEYYFSFDIDEKYDEYKREGYDEGYSQGYAVAIDIPIKQPLRDGNIDDKWTYLCDIFSLSYRDETNLYKRLSELIHSLNKSTYKDKNERQWININVD